MSNTPTPSMNELHLELKGLVRWKKFATHLRMMEQSDIDKTTKDNCDSAEQRLAVFGTWLHKCTNASWEDVVSALEKIDENILAEHLRMKYCPASSFLPPSSHSQSPPLSTSSDHRSSARYDHRSLTRSQQRSQFAPSVTSAHRSDWSTRLYQPSHLTPSLQTSHHSHSSTRSDRCSNSSTRSDRRSHSSTRSDPFSRSSTRSDHHSRSPTRSDQHSRSPTRYEHHSCSPTRSDQRRHSSTRSNHYSRSPTRSDYRSRSPTRSDPSSHSPTRYEHHSCSPTRSDQRRHSSTRSDRSLDLQAHKPTLCQLDTQLHCLIQWEGFGIHLPGITETDLQKIQSNNPMNVVRQKLALFGTWLRRYPSASWDDVILALEKVDEIYLAEQIKTKYTCEDRPAIGQEVYTSLPSEDVVFRELSDLHKTFTKLARDFRNGINKLVEPPNVHVLQEIITFIKDLQLYEIEGLNEVKTINTFIDNIRYHYNFLNCGLLDLIVEEYLNDLLPRTKAYIERVKEFKRLTPIQSLKYQLQPFVNELNISRKYVIVIVKLQQIWEEIDMLYLEKLVISLFPGYNPKWFTVRPGSLYCMFLIPKSKAKSYISSSSEKLQFMRLTGIFGLQIGITHVIRDDENESFTFDSALLEASQSGNNEAVQFLISLGVNVNNRNSAGRTALMLACAARHEEVVQTLLSAGSKVNIQDNAGHTALIFACVSGSLVVIRSLLSAKADPNLQNRNGNTAMHLACSMGNTELVNLLVKFNANPVIPNSKGETAFMISITNNSLDIVTGLIDLIPSTHIESAVITSCRLGYPSISSLLIRHLQLSSQVLDFFIASLDGDTTSLKQQLTQSGIDPNTTLISDITPLMIASSCEHIEVLECLLQAEADVNSKDEDGYTPLAYAITGSKSLTVIQRLLESGANPNILLGGISIIEKAKEENGTEEIVSLLMKYSARHVLPHWIYATSSSPPPSSGETAQMCTYENNFLGMVDRPLSAETDLDLHGENENKALHNACYNVLRELQTLLQNLNVSPVITDTLQGDEDFVISTQNKSITQHLVTACRRGDSAVIKRNTISQKLALVVACVDSNSSSVKQQLTQSGINPNTTLISNITPLMIASSCGHIEVLECLLQAKADVNSKDEDGYTPLAYAITGSKSLTAVQRLLQSGANPNILLGGISIIEKAKEENGTEEIVNLLLKYSALQLHKDYEQLPEKVKKSINEEKKLTILQVVEKIETHFPVTSLTKAQNAHELFNKLQPYYSFLSCDILVDITREFIGGEIENELEGYLVMMRKFQKSVKIKQLKEVMSLVPKQDDTFDTCDVNIKLNGEWEERTLENLQQLLKHMFHNKQYLLNHMTVDERDSLCITFTIPTSQSDGITDEVKRSKQFIKCVGVSRVSVGDVDVSIMEDSKFSFSSGLLRASENGINKAVQFLLEMGVNIDDVDSNGTTALCQASHSGHSKVVQILLKGGADPNIQKEDGWTALMYASWNGHFEVVQILLNGGADPNIRTKTGWTVLMSACKNGHSEVVQILLNGGADPNILEEDGWTALMYASQNGHSKVVQILLNGGADPNIQKEDGLTALMYASRNGHSEVVQILLNGGADPNIRMKTGWTVLMSACKNGHSEVVQILLNGGADPNILEEDGWTALMYASLNGHPEVVQILLNGGADPNIRTKTGWTALMSACKNGHSEVVQILLLLKGGADPNIQKEDGWTALMYASWNGHFEVVQILLNGGADPNIRTKTGWTALMSACKNGHSKVVQILLNGGADPNILEEDGWTALMYASQNGHSKVVQILLKGGADPNILEENGWTALMYASLNGHSDVVQILLNGGADPNIRTKTGWTALMSACKNGHSEVVQILLNGGADSNIRTKTGWTVLMSASENGHSEMVQILLKGEADPNSQKKDGKTALMYGSEKGYSNVVEVLLNGGADPKIKTKRGNKALAFAITNNHLQVVELLKTHK